MSEGRVTWEGYEFTWDHYRTSLNIDKASGGRFLNTHVREGARVTDATVLAILNKDKREYLRRLNAKPVASKPLSPRLAERAKRGQWGVQTTGEVPWTHRF